MSLLYEITKISLIFNRQQNKKMLQFPVQNSIPILIE
ncbi:Uncharacterised protein [uncultured Avibacterium sp.]|uniref:Uncharacterized protein n=1 Tax=uncultured Avibacterium sp. TaxID=1936169 RepID=A0A486XCP5_9PAST|nr:Uncharacterised protein [uncultured Avibacterium sp.]